MGDEIGPKAVEMVSRSFEGATEEIAGLPTVYWRIVETAGAHFFDSAMVVEKDHVRMDGLPLFVKLTATLARRWLPRSRTSSSSRWYEGK